ncbi:MAG TPA: universal stress protein [Pseudogracilibacillus sp.]|nr:universal stress protein [Pseudogracilibacillus sp.]
MYKRILLAVDGSDNSLRAADEAIKIASTNENSVVELLYIVDFDKVKSDVLHSSSQVALEHSRRGHLLPYEDKLETENIPYEVKILNGYPGPTISKYANEEDVDLVVIGSRGLNALQEMVLGSVSHKVVKKVEAPVLIVK